MRRLKYIQKIFTPQKKQISTVIKPELKQVYEKYLHSYETRKLQQINKTNQHISSLTQSNLMRINSKNHQGLTYSKEKYENCIFICLNGLPAFKGQFDFLNLPGIIYYLGSTGFQFDKNQNFRQSNLPNCTFSFNAGQINEIVKKNPKKDIVFVYHSFGTYNLSVYFHKYGIQRIKGLIQIGAAPIRQYIYLTEITKYCLHLTEEDLIKNKNQVCGKGLNELINRINTELNIKWDHFPSVTYAASFLHYFKSPQCPILFDLNRRYPNLLKLMIFGEDDNIFEKDLICERAQFYSNQQLNNQNELKNKFKSKFDVQTQKIQQNFIFMIPKGKHSLHLQKRNQQIIAKAAQQYLQFIFN